MINSNSHWQPGHRIAKVETFVWGICVPSSCTEKEVETAINYHLGQISNNGPFQFDVKINREVCYVEEKKEFSITKLLVTYVIAFQAIYCG